MKTKLSSINAARRVVFLSTILFFIVGTANAQYVEGWKKLCTGISENLYGVCCIDANTVVACGENGKILKSTDNGTTWNTTFEKEGYDLIHIGDNLLIVPWIKKLVRLNKGIIVKTIDGGITWQELENTAFATLCNEELLQYSKMVVSSPTSFSIFDGDQHIWSSCDGGLTFNTFELNLSTLYSQHPVCYSEMHFEDETGYLILGTDWYSIRVFKTPNYGIFTFSDLFTNRQLTALTTFSDLVSEAQEQAEQDAGLIGNRNAHEYGNAIGIYLAMVLDRVADRGSSICSWDMGYTKIRNTFGRQAIPMTWDYAEANPFSNSTGSFSGMVGWVEKCVRFFPAGKQGYANQFNAQSDFGISAITLSTDPPYYETSDTRTSPTSSMCGCAAI